MNKVTVNEAAAITQKIDADSINNTLYKKPLDLQFGFAGCSHYAIVRGALSLQDGYKKAVIIMAEEGVDVSASVWTVARW